MQDNVQGGCHAQTHHIAATKSRTRALARLLLYMCDFLCCLLICAKLAVSNFVVMASHVLAELAAHDAAFDAIESGKGDDSEQHIKRHATVSGNTSSCWRELIVQSL